MRDQSAAGRVGALYGCGSFILGDLYELGMFHRGAQWDTGGAAWCPQSHAGLKQSFLSTGFHWKGRESRGRKGRDRDLIP